MSFGGFKSVSVPAFFSGSKVKKFWGEVLGKTLFSLFSVTWDTDDLWKTILISHYFDCFLANCLICSFVKKTILFENITL